MSLRTILAEECLLRTAGGVGDDASGGLYHQQFAQAAAPFGKRAEQLRRWLKSQMPDITWEVDTNSWGPTWYDAGGASQGWSIYPKKKKGYAPRPASFYIVADAPSNSFGVARTKVDFWRFGASHIVDNTYRSLSGKGGKPPTLAALQAFIQQNIPDLRRAFSLPRDPTLPPPVVAYSPAEVKKIVSAARTWMELEFDKPTELTWTTRDHGDVGDERPGREDVAHARDLLAKVKARFPEAKGRVYTVDEWTSVTFEF